jgi:hypothetical protein
MAASGVRGQNSAGTRLAPVPWGRKDTLVALKVTSE